MKKSIIFICVFVLVMSISILPASAFAVPRTRGAMSSSYENNVYPCSPSNLDITGLERELFTFYLPDRGTFVVSGSTFQTGNLPSNSDIQYYGKVDAYHTQTGLTVGICTYNDSTGGYDIVHQTQFTSGKNGASSLIPVSRFSPSKRYYGFVDASNLGGNISGKVTYIYFDYDYYGK